MQNPARHGADPGSDCMIGKNVFIACASARLQSHGAPCTGAARLTLCLDSCQLLTWAGLARADRGSGYGQWQPLADDSARQFHSARCWADSDRGGSVEHWISYHFRNSRHVTPQRPTTHRLFLHKLTSVSDLSLQFLCYCKRELRFSLYTALTKALAWRHVTVQVQGRSTASTFRLFSWRVLSPAAAVRIRSANLRELNTRGS